MQPSTTVRVCVCVCVFFFYNWHRGTDPHPNPNPGRRSSWVNVDCRVWRCVSVSEDLLHLVTLCRRTECQQAGPDTLLLC